MKKQKIIGIDYSLTCPCWCILDDEDCMFYYVTPKKKYEGIFLGNIIGYGTKEYNDPVERFKNLSDTVLYCLEENYQLDDKHIFMEKGREYVRDEFKKGLAFMPGFHKLHKLVTQHYSIGLVTASPRHNLNWLQTLINLDELFEHIISGDETKKNKPHPEPYLSMMEKLNVKPENVVIILEYENIVFQI